MPHLKTNRCEECPALQGILNLNLAKLRISCLKIVTRCFILVMVMLVIVVIMKVMVTVVLAVLMVMSRLCKRAS